MSSMGDLLPTIRAEISKLKIAGTHDKVYKDECMYSFDSPFSPNGLYVNLKTLQGFGEDFLRFDIERGGKLYLHEKWTQVPKDRVVSTTEESGDAPTKLAIGLEGGFVVGEAQYDLVKVNALVVVTSTGLRSIQLPNAELPEFVVNVAQSVIDHDGMRSKMQASTWDADNERVESKYARGLEQLQNGKKISQDPSTWKCEESEETQNLWLNLSTGYIGGGRKNWDGSGGSGAALKHFEETGRKYPLCVKLGTITANSADVYSYAPDEDDMVIDPLLPQHLSHWGIDIMKLEKTDKTMTELEVDLNMKYDWSRILESGEELEALRGPGFVGLRNIGSTCYLNSVMQTILSIPEVQGRYLGQRESILRTANDDPAMDFATQMSKLAHGVLTGAYVAPPSSAGPDAAEGSAGAITVQAGEEAPDESALEKYVVAPRMFKQLVGHGHQEFSGGRQQDASEYFMHFLQVMTRAERTALTRIASPPIYTGSLFEFELETRYECAATRQVRYISGRQSVGNTLELRIPLESATNREQVEMLQESKKARHEGKEGEKEEEKKSGDTKAPGPQEEEDVKLVVPFEACLETFFGDEVVEYKNPSIGHLAPANRRARLKTFPRYLMIKLGRYFVGPNWVQVKVDARVPVPEHLDLTAFRGLGKQEWEEGMLEEAASGAGGSAAAGEAAAASSAVEPNAAIVESLLSMGFGENACKRAALAVANSDAEAATNWLFAHMEDADINDPVPTGGESGGGGSGGAPSEAVDMITSMGYTVPQAEAALKATDNNLERAVDWIFSHMDDLDAAVAQANITSTESATGEAGVGAASTPATDDGEGKYTLMAIISHIGKNTDHGHYVCHIKKDGVWALFNDEKVAKSKSPPLEYGFMYLFRRDDGPGSF